jgi:hypothetical protein
MREMYQRANTRLKSMMLAITAQSCKETTYDNESSHQCFNNYAFKIVRIIGLLTHETKAFNDAVQLGYRYLLFNTSTKVLMGITP